MSDSWYKEAERSRMIDDSGAIIEGPDMDKLNPTKVEMIKDKLQRRYPKVNWTLEKVMKWINKNFIGKPQPSGPKDLLHRPLDD